MDRPLMLQVNMPVFDTIHPQSNMFVYLIDEEIKA